MTGASTTVPPDPPDGDRLRADLRRTYRRVAAFYDLLDLPFERRYHRLRPEIFTRVAEARTLLDCGVGTGQNTPYYPRGARVVGIDLSAEMMRRAERRARTVHRPLTCVQADVTRLPWRDAVFDAATATFLFCVLPDALQLPALREIARVVKPGGRIVLLEYRLSDRPVRRWIMRHFWARWVRLAYHAGFERRTSDYLEQSGVVLEERRLVHDDVIVMLVARTQPSAGGASLLK